MITDEKTEIRFVADADLMQKLQKLKSLLSHSLSDQSYAQLINKLSDEVLKHKDPEKKTIKVTPPAESKQSHSRYIPAPLRRAVWQRAHGKCQHRDPKTGKTCGSTFQLQIDHLVPFSLGGGNELENLELVCRNHNLLRAVDHFGDETMSRYQPL